MRMKRAFTTVVGSYGYRPSVIIHSISKLSNTQEEIEMLFIMILAIAVLIAVVAVSIFGMLLIKAAIEDILEEFR